MALSQRHQDQIKRMSTETLKVFIEQKMVGPVGIKKMKEELANRGAKA